MLPLFLLALLISFASADPLFFRSLEKEENVRLCADGRSSCQRLGTCCINATRQFNCCPLKHAVCCDDGEHCCPENFRCDAVDKKCHKDDTGQFIDLLKLVTPAKEASQITLGDMVTFWKDKPRWKIPSLDPASDDIKCPDHTSSCPDNTTCCPLKNKYYGCCPYPQAVCCKDLIHCCPHDTQCNDTTGECMSGITDQPRGDVRLQPRPDIRPEVQHEVQDLSSSIICPDKKSKCPSDTTCCELESGGYGCCPFKNAHCCSDHVHCCSEEQKCDVAKGECVDQNNDLVRQPWAVKTASEPIEGKCPEVGMCPHPKSCCKSKLPGQYACCPMPNSICCSDQVHCCPEGFSCDLRRERCVMLSTGLSLDLMRQLNQPFMLKHQVHEIIKNSDLNQICPDQGSCSDTSTCCMMPDHSYGCCPLMHATCCLDHVHCCPQGYRCDLGAERCLQEEKQAWLQIQTTRQQEVDGQKAGVICPDKKTCSENDTCCHISESAYGCCPLPQATCCSDDQHCCPHGYTCDTTQETCVRGDSGVSVPWISKIATASRAVLSDTSQYTLDTSQDEQRTNDFTGKCRDNTTCPDQATCCKIAEPNTYACCPLHSGVCCSDHIHCCPEGFTCDLKDQKCVHGRTGEEVELATHVKPATQQDQLLDAPSHDAMCPNHHHCADNYTCCPLVMGLFGCCPLPGAVCCSDKLHCCPRGSTCDLEHQTCEHRNTVLGMSKIKHPRDPESNRLLDLDQGRADEHGSCRDGSVCPEDSTCCTRRDGTTSCCPFNQAVCCPDALHCCPDGFTCLDDTSACINSKGSIQVSWTPHYRRTARPRTHSIPWLNKTPASTPASTTNMNQCPDKKHYCPEDQTCCKTVDQSYGCCPSPKASCCSDMKHCCPEGYKCQEEKSSCVKQ